MLVNYLYKGAWLIGLVLLQVLVLNNLHIAGYATPFVYIYLLLKFESDVSRHALMLWAFFLGLSVDMFSDTPGMNAAAAVLLAFLRPWLLRLFMARDVNGSFKPSIRSMGIGGFFKYTLWAVLLHHSCLFAIELFSFWHWDILLLSVVFSTLLSTAIILALEGIRRG